MDKAAALISAIADLLWPLFAIAVILLFREPIKQLVGRLRKGKFLGQEIELERSLQALEESAQASARALPPNEGETGGAAIGPEEDASQEDETDLIRRVLTEADASPKSALILLAAEMERELRQLLASMGLLKGSGVIALPRAINIFEERGALPPSLSSSVSQFWDTRNRIVHGHVADRDDILRAIDSGLTILRSIRAIPHEVNVVSHPGVEIYADSRGERVRPGVKAVLLETTTPGGADVKRRVFPTTRDHFVVGQRVAWEWDLDHQWGESWYRDPDTNEVKVGWLGSGEFVGRPLDDV